MDFHSSFLPVRLNGREYTARLDAYLLSQVLLPREGVTAPRPAVIICPGGSYQYTSLREAEPPAMAFLAAGIDAFVLHYSCAPQARFPVALVQLARAVAHVRERAAQWNIDPHRIAVCGFSAGGHLAACLGTLWDRPFLREAVRLPADSFRPDRLLLCYAVTGSGRYSHRLSMENLLGPEGMADQQLLHLLDCEAQVGPTTPPTFLWTAQGDQSVPPQNSLRFALALQEAGRPLELHVYPRGKHALSVSQPFTARTAAENDPVIRDWVSQAVRWLRQDEV